MVLDYKQMSSRPFPALFSDIPEFQGLLSSLQRPPEAITTGVTPYIQYMMQLKKSMMLFIVCYCKARILEVYTISNSITSLTGAEFSNFYHWPFFAS